MAYKRETVFPCKLLIGFTKEQRAALEAVAEKDEKSLAWVVRDCVDLYLRMVADRRGTEFKRAVRKAEGR